MKNTTVKISPSRRVFLVCNTIFLSLALFLCVYPLWYVFVQSLSDGSGAVDAVLWPVNFTLSNYEKVMAIPEIFHAFVISILRTVIGTLLTMLACMFLGYLFSKQEMPFHKLLYRTLVITMYVSGGLIPTYLVYRSYGLLNNFWVYILPSIISAYNVILVKTYVEQMPISLEESAMIDGADTITIFAKIILPLAMPIAATIAIYASVGQWNAWFDNQIYTVTAKNLTTLQFLLYNYLNEAEQLLAQLKETGLDPSKILTPRGVKMTVTMVTVIPILCVYPFMQRYLIKGIMIGAVKG
jgi:putative aldouronate transport system permease protein